MPMGKKSRDKGKAGERELASKLREYGYDARRGVQFHGGPDSPDVVGLPGIHRKNNCPWVVVMELPDWIELYSAWEADRGE